MTFYFTLYALQAANAHVDCKRTIHPGTPLCVPQSTSVDMDSFTHVSQLMHPILKQTDPHLATHTAAYTASIDSRARRMDPDHEKSLSDRFFVAMSNMVSR